LNVERSTLNVQLSTTARQFDFASLKFDPSRTVLYVFEVAAKLRITEQHVVDLIDEGKLRAVNIGGKGVSARTFYRIPVEAWEAYLRANTL